MNMLPFKMDELFDNSLKSITCYGSVFFPPVAS